MLHDLKFQFVPVAHVRDWRFAVTFYGLLVLAFLYSVGSMFFFHQYCFYSPATALTCSWFLSTRNPSNNGSSTHSFFCNNASYDFTPPPEEILMSGNFTFSNSSCVWLNDAVVTTMSADGMSITTSTMTQPNMSGRSGNTYSGFSSSHFMVDLDSLVANFQHSVNMPIGPPILNPPTILYDSKGNVYKSFGHPGEQPFVSLTLRDVLRIVDVSLEEWNPVAGVPIRYRNTGLLVAVNLEYSNAFNWQVPLELRCKMTLELQPGSWGQIGWCTPGDEAYTRQGVLLNFVVQGQLAAFSFTSLVTHLISSYVLIGLCRTAVVMLISVLSARSDDFAKRHKLELRPEVFCSEFMANRIADLAKRKEDDDEGKDDLIAAEDLYGVGVESPAVSSAAYLKSEYTGEVASSKLTA